MSLYLSWSFPYLVVIMALATLAAVLIEKFSEVRSYKRFFTIVGVLYLAIIFAAVDNGTPSSQINRSIFNHHVENIEIEKVDVEDRREVVKESFDKVVHEKGEIQ